MDDIKRIIDGKTYNTKTADFLAEACNPTAGRSDFAWWQEELYRSPKGKLFLAGEGGAMSQWSRSYPGGGSQSGDGIRLVTEDDARGWAERWLDADEYMTIFGVEEG